MGELKLEVSNLVNYSEATRMLGISRPTIYAMIEREELHPVVIADRRYLLRDEIERLVLKRHPEGTK